MNYRAFCNYMSTIQNAIDAEHNHHPENSKITFQNNGKWALRLLEKVYADKDQNLRRWLNGKPCRFTSDITGRMVEVTIGNDWETLYYFLTFCKKLGTKQEISDEFREYLAYLTARSVYGEVE